MALIDRRPGADRFTDIRDLVEQICDRFDLDQGYVQRLDIHVDHVDVTLFAGREGVCKGAKYVDKDETGQPVRHVLTFDTRVV